MCVEVCARGCRRAGSGWPGRVAAGGRPRPGGNPARGRGRGSPPGLERAASGREAGGKPGRAARARESMIRPVGRVTAAGPGERRCHG